VTSTDTDTSTDTSTATVSRTELRARFAARLSALYGAEVPAYTTLVEVSRQVNRRVLERRPADAERFGSIERVTAERHGAIRVGSPRELAQVARIFAALGMFPCGFYDLRDARPAPIPVVATAFRPLGRSELAVNPFRVFTSMLVPEDRRFFDADLRQRLQNFLGTRRLFPGELLDLADRAARDGGLDARDADGFLELATGSFALSREPVDRAWYSELERISSVAADIGGVTTTHVNHLTPRVLDIDDLYAAMAARGVRMIDRIQGPPRWEGPDILLRQTSFRALAEPRDFREPDGSVTRGALRVRFGEVEARGIAPTAAGRDLYERMLRSVDERSAADPGADRQAIAVDVWREHLPRTEEEVCLEGLGFFRFAVDAGAARRLRRSRPEGLGDVTLGELVRHGAVVPEPIVYEDFLPRSAAGIFASNLTGGGTVDDTQGGAERTVDWMSGVVGAEIPVPEQVYAEDSAASLTAVERELTILCSGGRGAPVSVTRPF
jgi:uncharacterized glyoxalase superfamily metalloenzyme YdcJ